MASEPMGNRRRVPYPSDTQVQEVHPTTIMIMAPLKVAEAMSKLDNPSIIMVSLVLLLLIAATYIIKPIHDQTDQKRISASLHSSTVMFKQIPVLHFFLLSSYLVQGPIENLYVLSSLVKALFLVCDSLFCWKKARGRKPGRCAEKQSAERNRIGDSLVLPQNEAGPSGSRPEPYNGIACSCMKQGLPPV